ncbi:MAG TPA: EamA family transporter [Terriglobales bacterium]|nr:EamA family transporter [Terriglobales bacterium]
MTLPKYLILAAIVICSTLGDFLLKVGMNQMGDVSLVQDPLVLVRALMNPWVAVGTLVLIGFFVAFTIALSWADLSYVMPSTALGYVLTTILSSLALHEHVSMYRWAGVVLISLAVGFVTQGKARTVDEGAAA